jgi:aspartate aminotransferase-like enzyme
MKRVTLRLQYFFQTTAPVMTFPASGTGGQECAIANLFSAGDHVVAITIGSFGNRLAKIAEVYGVQVTRIEFPWGEAADPAIIEARLKGLAPYKAVLVTHNETSTGVTNDIQTLASLMRRLAPEALIVVDAVSSLGCVPLEMDLWDLDVVFTGSQKGWMTPPGLVMVAAGPRALEANKTAKLPRFYFDWGLSLKRMQSWEHPTTPPVSIFYALDQGLEMMLAEGRQAIFARHLKAGAYVRQRAKAMGLELLADHPYASNTVTAVKLPESVDSKGLLNTLRETDGIVLAGGQDQLAGKIFRVGHLGFFTENDLKEAMDAMEKRLPEFGFKR